MVETTSHSQSEKDECTLDSILVCIGQFGRYQIMNYFFLCVPIIFNAIFSVSYVFTAASVVHRCNVTECDNVISKYYEPWTNFTIPFERNSLDQCNRYEAMEVSNANNMCFEENFDINRVKPCDSGYIFRDKEVTISNDFGIYCGDEWKLSMVGTVNNVGQFIGIPLGGLIADKFGRRTMLAIGGSLSALMGTIRSYAPNYGFFLAFEMLDMVVGSTLFPTVFILAIELVGPKRRVLACTAITVFYAFGEAILAATAKYIQNWRIILRLLYIPALIHILYFWILPESIRWLLSQGRDGEAKKILKKAAATNKREIPESNLDQMILCNRENLKKANESQFPLRKAMKILFWRICNCCLCWFTHTLTALGLSINSVNLDGNKYHNFMLSALVTIPGMFLPCLIMDRFGRRYSLCASMLACGICIAASIFVGKDQPNLELILFLIGKLTITSSFNVLYFFTSEIFPTNVRNSLLSMCSMIGRIGSMVAPQTPLIAKYYIYAPQILFASFAFLSGTLTLFFPETTNKILPTTMEEANHIGGKIFDKKREKNGKTDVEMM